MKLSSPHLSKYLISDLLDYSYKVVNVCRERQPPMSPTEPQVDAVQAAGEALNQNFKIEQANALSGRIAVLDVERDRLIVGFRTTVEGLTYHYDAPTASAASLILAAIDKYGNIARLTYESESVSINSLLNDLTTNEVLVTALKTINLSAWTTQMRSVNDQFQAAYVSRVGNVTDTKHTPTPELRNKLVTVIRELFSHLTAHATLNPSPTITAIITDINTLTTRHNQLADSRTSRSKESASETAGVDSTTGI